MQRASVIGRDGQLYEFFDPAYYAFHLGVKGDDNYFERHSINIELESYGGLVMENGNWVFKYNKNKPGKVIEPNDVSEVSWRGYDAFQAYTPAQIKTLVILLEYLYFSGDWPDLKIYNPTHLWYEYNPRLVTRKYPGLYSHTTVREDKSDIAPQPIITTAINEFLERYQNDKPKYHPVKLEYH